MNIKYTLGTIVTVPLLPILYFQAKKLRKDFPKLPEAKGTEGKTTIPSEKTLRMLTIGESTIAGVGVKTHKEGFTGTLAEELARNLNTNIAWKVYAKSGYSAKKVNKEIINTITEKNINLIIIGLGANDAFELNTPRKWNKDVHELIRSLRLKFKGIPIVFLNMPPIKKFPAFTSLMKFSIGNLVNILGKEVGKIIKEYDDVFYFNQEVNYTELISKYAPKLKVTDLFSDGVHPSAITYQIWAKEFAFYITESTRIKKTIE